MNSHFCAVIIASLRFECPTHSKAKPDSSCRPRPTPPPQVTAIRPGDRALVRNVRGSNFGTTSKNGRPPIRVGGAQIFRPRACFRAKTACPWPCRRDRTTRRRRFQETNPPTQQCCAGSPDDGGDFKKAKRRMSPRRSGSPRSADLSHAPAR
jgi:hypothetical protein